MYGAGVQRRREGAVTAHVRARRRARRSEPARYWSVYSASDALRRAGRRTTARPGGRRVRHPAGREPRRDRLPHHPHGTRARAEDGRGALRRGRRRPARARRRPCGAARTGPRRRERTCGPTRFSTRPRRPAPVRFTPATGSCPRTRVRARGRGRRDRVRRPDARAAVRSATSTRRARRRWRRASRSSPGSGLLASIDDAVAAAADVGYPVMLKAVGGGGGIGMQACADAAELRGRVRPRAAPRGGATSAPPGCSCERFVARARHVEVQVFGDGTGRVVSLGTRDCSLQRRNQKVVEEAPAPGLPDDVGGSARVGPRRSHVGRLPLRGHRRVRLRRRPRAGPFLEMNTRLQVEHPVTEAVTGVDLVGWMLRLARGEAALLDGVPDAGPRSRERRRGPRLRRGPPQRLPPSAGLLTGVEFPARAGRHWAETGQQVTATTTRCSPR